MVGTERTAGTSAMASYESSKMIYDRVRIVNIDCEGFMSCSCGKVQMYMMPCRHICAIIDKKEFYVPSMFHIRWHKMFNYYHGNNFGAKLATHSTQSINKIVTLTRKNTFARVVPINVYMSRILNFLINCQILFLKKRITTCLYQS